MLRYGLTWPHNDAIAVERLIIRGGGYLNVGSTKIGNGLFFHYRAVQSLLWPEDDHHRWSDLILKEYLENRITCVYGSRDSSKTRTVSKAALVDYYFFPDDTLILMTSTDTRGLELRVWGDIKSLHDRAKQRCEWLPGNLADSKHGLFTDGLSEGEEVRDMRRGIIGIPCLSSQGDYMGLALKNFAGIKQKRRRLIGDECFPPGTLVNTIKGLWPIEHIHPGDVVLSAAGYRNVLITSRRIAQELARVKLLDGRSITCTPNHPVLTQKGWKTACELNGKHYILGPYESLRSLRYSNQEQNYLLQEMLVRRDVHASGHRVALHSGATKESEREGSAEDAYGKSHERSGMCSEGQRFAQSCRARAESQGRKRHWTNKGGVAVDSDVSRGPVELWHQNREVEWERLSCLLQSGFSISRHQACGRGRWFEPFQLGWQEGQRSEEGQIPSGAWVDRVEVIKQNDPRFQSTAFRDGLCEVYNLQVEGHPSYCVNGLVVHNCQFMPREYLKVLDSLDKGDFRAAFLGNPIAENGKALDAVSEPVGGWDSLGEFDKTKVWKNKYNGVTINLVGIDSPNFDKETPNRFPYLVDQGDVDRVSKRPGAKDSVEWWSQIMGIRKVGAVSNRVLTVREIESYDGFKDCIWSGQGERTKVYSIDAGFGGDECVRTWLEFGEVVDGQKIIRFGDQKVIPILVSSTDSPEKQIAKYARADCATLGIPAAHLFCDAGMYATLMVELAREMGPEVNAVNFGGTATERPVDNQTFVWDERTQSKRLKTWYEHVSKFVTELYFVVRLLAQCRQARMFPRGAAEEFGRRQWDYVSNNRYELETKDDYKLRNSGESPNRADSLVIAVEGARRLGFAIEAIPEPGREPKADDDYLEKELKRYQQERRTRTLHYT